MITRRQLLGALGLGALVGAGLAFGPAAARAEEHGSGKGRGRSGGGHETGEDSGGHSGHDSGGEGSKGHGPKGIEDKVFRQGGGDAGRRDVKGGHVEDKVFRDETAQHE